VSDANEQLAKALRSLRVDPEVARRDDWMTVAQAAPDPRQAAGVYAAVNDRLASIVERGPLPIHHITGEARALVDPAHRRVLRADHAHGAEARLACWFESNELSAWEFVGGEHGHWRGLEWVDLIDILALGAYEVIRICRLDEPAETHFSIFGDDLVLLQQPHDHPQLAKWVWFVQSPSLVQAAWPQLDSLFCAATPIEPSSFNRVLVWLNSYEAFEGLTAIAEGRPLDDAEPDEDQDAETRRRLGDLGFAESDQQALTRLGREWLDRISTSGGS
jgi:hypothetical protein